jgi:hypothetical protein
MLTIRENLLKEVLHLQKKKKQKAVIFHSISYLLYFGAIGIRQLIIHLGRVKEHSVTDT